MMVVQKQDRNENREKAERKNHTTSMASKYTVILGLLICTSMLITAKLFAHAHEVRHESSDHSNIRESTYSRSNCYTVL